MSNPLTSCFSSPEAPKKAPPPSPNQSAPAPKQQLTFAQKADQYHLAYNKAWEAFPKWKRIAIEQDRKEGRPDGRFWQEFLVELELVVNKSL
jgi:hypothetical protein